MGAFSGTPCILVGKNMVPPLKKNLNQSIEGTPRKQWFGRGFTHIFGAIYIRSVQLYY
jgi:hypothetical protein